MTRTTLNNIKLDIHEDKLVELKIRTRVPTKYILIDAENGKVYKGTNIDTSANNMYWTRISISEELVIPIINKLYINE